jgi:site-specific recombinase XerD
VRLNERWINVIGKGNKLRQVIINNEMYDALQEYLQERLEMNINSPYLFVGQKTQKNGGKHLNRNFCNRLLSPYKNYCKSTNLHPHLMRALFCTNALHNAGYTVDQVANQAGHSSINTTNRYLKVKKEDLLDLANRQ